MARKDINIKINADSENADKGINKLTKNLNKLSKSAKLSSLAKLGSAAGGAIKTFEFLTKTIKKTTAELKEMGDLYNKQIKAEKQLEVAAKNNPYLNKASVKQLKNYASELQSIGTIGDEELLPLMANLASSGRTQAEIQKIMSAALDVSASGMMSMESAVQQLNASYNGNIGLMGRQIGELKTLTKEELQNGKAIDIVAEKFKGMAKETADATGTSERLANAWGDLKEELGAPFEKAMSPMRAFFADLVSGWANALSAKRKYKEALVDVQTGKADSEDFLEIIEKKKKELEKATKKLQDKGFSGDTDEERGQNAEKFYKDRVGTANAQGGVYFAAKEYVEAKQALEEYQKKFEEVTVQEEAENKRQQAKEKQAELDKKSADAKAQLQDKIKSLTQTEIEALEEEKRVLQELYDSLTEKDKQGLGEGFKNAISALDTQIESAKDKAKQSTIDKVNDAFSCISQISSQIESSLSRIKDVMTANSEAEQEQLDEQLKTGLISQSQYEKEKVKLEQKAAMETYKINMAMWAAQLLQGAANIALGVTQALGSSPPPVNFIMAATTAAAGAVEMGTLIASKPKRPSFETGGIVQGNSYSGDRVQANVNSGEMILNARQQAQLWKAATGNSAIGGMQVNIMNSAANIVSATPTLNGNTLDLRIDARVTSQASKGKYSQAFNQGETISTSGVTYPL